MLRLGVLIAQWRQSDHLTRVLLVLPVSSLLVLRWRHVFAFIVSLLDYAQVVLMIVNGLFLSATPTNDLRVLILHRDFNFAIIISVEHTLQQDSLSLNNRWEQIIILFRIILCHTLFV